MPAVSKAQQKFFGIVRAIQKGEMAPTTPETAKAAADMKKSDVKKFASTKHKGLPDKKVSKEEKNYDQRNKILKRAKPLHKHLYKNLHKGDRTGDVNEKIDLTDRKQMRRIADAEKRHKEQDKRMKFGKFYAKAKEARDRLRPGEVKKWDKEKGRFVSNKE
jgi:hypothetical protein